MGTIFTLTLYQAPELQCLLEGNYTYAWCPVFAADAQRTPLNRLFLVARQACSPASHGTVAMEGRGEKDIKGIQNGKKEVKLSLFADGIIL